MSEETTTLYLQFWYLDLPNYERRKAIDSDVWWYEHIGFTPLRQNEGLHLFTTADLAREEAGRRVRYYESIYNPCNFRAPYHALSPTERNMINQREWSYYYAWDLIYRRSGNRFQVHVNRTDVVTVKLHSKIATAEQSVIVPEQRKIVL